MWRLSLVSVVATVLLLGGVTQAARDITKPGDVIQGIPNDGVSQNDNHGWPGNEPPHQAIDDQVVTKYLHFKGDIEPTGLRITPKAGATVVTGLSFTTANDAEPRDPVKYELSGSNVSIDGPYTPITSGDIKDFAAAVPWPRRTKNTTPIKFANTTAYLHYQLMFPAIRDAPNANSMQIAEIELLMDVFKATAPNPVDGAVITVPLFQWTKGDTAVQHKVYLGTSPDLTEADLKAGPISAASAMYYHVLPPLEPGVTYYWRVDQIDAAGTVYEGDVWKVTAAPKKAYNPAPRDGDKWISVATTLTWTPGAGATKHQVYLGTDQAAVAARDASVSVGDTIAPLYDPQGLEQKTTYYWAVDEIAGAIKYDGSVWSFTTEGGGGGIKGEYFSNTDLIGLPVLTRIDPQVNINLTGATSPGDPVPGDGWSARWTADLDIAVADTFKFSVNCQDGTRLWIDGELVIDQWITPTVTSKYFSLPIYLESGIHSLRLEFFDSGGDAVEQLAWSTATMAEVIIPAGPLQPPLRARALYPADGEPNVPQEITLIWGAGEEANEHDLYFGDSEDAVANATTDSADVYQGRKALDETSFEPGELEWNKTYYWRVDEVNDAYAESPWKSSVWSFTTADFLVVDDFEGYNDEEGMDTRIYETWIDGWVTGNGSTVGNWDPPFAEQTIVRSGLQSMPFDYNNFKSPFYSEAYREFAPVQDWTVNGVTDLTLFLQGYPPKFLDDAGVITMSAQGADIWGPTDEFRLAFKQLNGDGSITLRVDDVKAVHSWTKAGVMIRSSLDPLAAQVHMVTGAQQSVVEWMYRMFANDTTTTQFNTTGGTNPLPAWVRLTRAGNVFTGEYSADGVTWSKITTTDGTTSSATVTMPSSVYIGFVVSSHTTGVSAVAQFSEIKTTGTVTGQWKVADIGVDHAGNDPAPLYVAIEDNTGQKVAVTHPDPAAVNATDWTEWKIPLSDFAGVNPAKVKKLYIGVGDKSAVGHGKIYIDDIRVTKP